MATYIPGVTDVFPEPSLFTPDFSYMDKMLQRRQSMYEQGFAELNSKYNFISKDVTHIKNKELRDQFLKQAKDNLKNLSAMDLSQQQNVDAAGAVFEPFIKNTNIVGDQLVTEHWNQQRQIAESFRLKDGGKEFSQDNINYVLMQQQEFANSSPDAWQSYYSNRRSYNPYYDYHKEYTEAMKNFKPSSYELDKINGLYKITEKDASAKEADIKRYLDAVLSPKAKEQMRIEGIVRYGSDIDGLSKTYTASAQSEINLNNINISKYNKALALEKDPNKQAEIKSLIEKNKEENNDISRNLQKIKEGDLSFIKANSEKLASSIYYNQTIGRISNGYSYDNISTKINGDTVGLALMKENRADARQLRGFKHAEDMLKLKATLQSRMNAGEFSIENAPPGAENIQNTMKDLNTKVDAIQSTRDDIVMQTKQHIFSLLQGKDPSIRSVNDIDQGDIDRWLKTGGPNGTPVPKTDLYYQNLQKLNALAAEENSYTNRLNNIYEAGFGNLSEAERNRVKAIDAGISSISDIVLDDGRRITASELSRGIESGSIKYEGAKKGWWDFGAPTKPEFTIGGKKYVIDFNANNLRTGGGNLKLFDAYRKVSAAQKDPTYQKFHNNIENYSKTSGEARVYNSQRARYYAGSNADKILNSTVSNIFPEYEIQQTGVGLSTNNQGDIYYMFSTKGQDGGKLNDSDLEKIQERMTARGYETEVVGSEGGGYELRVKGIKNSVTNNLRTFNRQQSLIVDEAASYGGAQKYTTGYFTTNNSNTKFWITKSYGLYYLNIEGLDDPLPETFSNPTDAVAKANILTANNEAFLNAYKQAANY